MFDWHWYGWLRKPTISQNHWIIQSLDMWQGIFNRGPTVMKTIREAFSLTTSDASIPASWRTLVLMFSCGVFCGHSDKPVAGWTFVARLISVSTIFPINVWLESTCPGMYRSLQAVSVAPRQVLKLRFLAGHFKFNHQPKKSQIQKVACFNNFNNKNLGRPVLCKPHKTKMQTNRAHWC